LLHGECFVCASEQDGSKIGAVRDFDAKITKIEQSLAGLKRSYTMKLFAGTEETTVLFDTLMTELEKITKAD